MQLGGTNLPSDLWFWKQKNSKLTFGGDVVSTEGGLVALHCIKAG